MSREPGRGAMNDPKPLTDEEIERLVMDSSIGSPNAQAVARLVPPGQVEEVLRRIEVSRNTKPYA